MSQIDRREFLDKTAKGAAVGVAATSLLGSKTRAQEARVQGANDRIVVGVMGLSRGRSLAVGFAKQPNVDIKYVCDTDSTRAESCVQLVEGAGGKTPKAIGDFRQILDDKDVDVLVCAAPNHWHAPATIMACNAGKHVYVEKPCSHNPWEGETMVAAARKHNRCVQMGSQRRSGDGLQRAMAELKDGVIGRVYLTRAWYFSVRGSLGTGKQADPPANLDYDLWQGPAPRTPYIDNRVHYNWHWFWQWGNGELGNNGIHTLDICRWGLGVDYPVRVTSSGGRYRFDDDQETPDTHTVCFEFDNDSKAVWEGISCNRHGSGFVSFYGENGAMDVDQAGGYKIYDGPKDKLLREEKGTTRGDNEHFVNLLDAIRNDDPTRLNSEIEIGHKSTLLCHLGNIAHRTDRVLNCDPKNGHILKDEEAAGLWKRDYEPGWEPKVV
jgi:predicted dehydrogenase